MTKSPFQTGRFEGTQGFSFGPPAGAGFFATVSYFFGLIAGRWSRRSEKVWD